MRRFLVAVEIFGHVTLWLVIGFMFFMSINKFLEDDYTGSVAYSAQASALCALIIATAAHDRRRQ